MKLNALLMCREPQSARVLATSLDELNIERELCGSTSEALELLAQRHFSALLADFDLSMASQLVRLARMAPAQRRPVVFGVIGALTHVGNAFQSGANFVLYKPLVLSQVSRTLRGGRVFMRPDRRDPSRQQLETLVYLRFGDDSVPAIVVNVSQRGLAVQAAQPLPRGRLRLHFVLPGTEHLLEGTGEVIWADDSGRAGILFKQLPTESADELKLWIANHARKDATRGVVRHPQHSHGSIATRPPLPIATE
jgi:CheY-like chemotaxis protein